MSEIFIVVFTVQRGSTGAGSVSQGLREAKGVKGTIGVNGGKVAAMEAREVGEGEEDEEEETDPNFLLRSWMPSWMRTMPW